MDQSINTPAPRPIVFGEVLFDRFEDGAEVLGGAPFNVAWHLHGLGLAPLLVTRLGDDEPGRRIRAAMAAAGLSLDGVQVDPDRATGEVTVKVEGGQPTFSIDPGQAWDFIDADAAGAAAAGGEDDVLYHGTLALRSPESRAALQALRAGPSRSVFLDVNLREPWWTPEAAAEALAAARWAKLNGDELKALGGAGDPGEAARGLAAVHGLEGVVVTLGAGGALWADAEAIRAMAPAADVPAVADTVGAGDAFAAVCILGLARGWPERTILVRAAGMAAAVCALPGAVPADPEFHARFLNEWR